MERIFVENIAEFEGKNVELRGWAHNFRCSGKIAFVQFRDGSGRVQIVYEKSKVSEEAWKLIEGLTIESSVIVRGQVVKDDRSPLGFEIQGREFEVVQLAEEYPIGKKEHGPDFLLDHRHLWLRSEKQWAIQRIRHTITMSIYNFFNDNGYTKIDAPIMTPTPGEGTTDLFEIEYFDRKAYLSQTGQLYLEAAMASFGKVFDFGPVFRAEKSKTRRHLTEFWMMDAEQAYVEHEENMKIQEDLLVYIVNQVLEKNQKELKILERDIEALKKIKAPFIRMSHAEAVKKLHELGSDIKEDDDLGGDDETILTNEYDNCIFIDRYPAKVKAFYMKRDPENDNLALCADLLAPEGYGEISGGSEREADLDVLKKRIAEHKLPAEAFEWYLDLRRYGSVPHSGFGFGLERIVTWLCGIHHVRETIPFPRLINRLEP